MPYGQCVDRHGRVFIADFSSGSTYEYLHGHVGVPHNIFPYPGAGTGEAIGCSVDRTDDLAVSYFTTSGGAGEIAVWTNETGTPAQFSYPSCYYMWPPGYDRHLDLFVEGETSSGTVNVCELAHGASAMNSPTLSGVPTIYFPGSVMWDGHYIALSDQKEGGNDQEGIYYTKAFPTLLVYMGSSILTDTCNGTMAVSVQPFIVGSNNTPLTTTQGNHVVGGNQWCSNGTVDVWPYPAGGAPTATATPAPALPYGESVSFP
jgi:hypothetical protein